MIIFLMRVIMCLTGEVEMNRQQKVMWQAADKKIRKIMSEPRKQRATMDWLVPKPHGYTGI